MANKGEMIELGVGSSNAQGYFTEPAEGGARPGLIVVHEWWGLNDHMKDVADRFAAEGYAVLAPDLYGGKSTKDPDEAGKLMQGLDHGKAIETLNGAVEYLQSRDGVKSDAIGVTGFCMGGTFALVLPCINKNIKASAPFYGDVPSEDMLKNLSAPILFIGAENDPWITKEKMESLKNGLTKFNKEGEVKIYPGVSHAFFNDTRPDAYDREAAHDAWKSVTQFFAEKLQ